jgi:hypothetical protein
LRSRELLLTHSGRRGLRQVLLDVIAHESASDTYIVPAGWGKQADWFRTI